MNTQAARVQSKVLEFRFKGDRNYIHGTDIFNTLVGERPPASVRNVHFTIHGFVRTPRCQLYQADSREILSELRDVKVRASFELDGVAQWLALTESSAPGPAGRYDYAEERVTSRCDVRDQRITLEQKSPFTFIETVVAMDKHLHQRLFPSALGKWIFTGIDLKQGCGMREGISLQVGRDVNYRLTRADIAHDGNAIGSLFFSLVK